MSCGYVGHVIGASSRQNTSSVDVTVEVALDLVCPFSKKAWITLQKVAELYPDRVRIKKV